MRGRLLGCLAFIAICFGVMVVRPVQIEAHADLLNARPEPGAVLPISPSVVTLTFSEAISGGTIDIFAQEFARIDGVFMVPAEKENELTADLPELGQGRYTVQWSVLSTDGHNISGSYAFEVNEMAEAGWVSWLFVLFVLAGFGGLWLQRRRIIKREDRAYGL